MGRGKVACDGWAAKNPIPAGQLAVATYSSIVRRVEQSVKDVLDGEYPGGSSAWLAANFTPAQAAADQSNFSQLQRVYQTCMRNTPTAGLEGLKTIMSAIADLYPARQDAGRRQGVSLDVDPGAMGKTLAFFVQHGLPSLVDALPSRSTASTQSTARNGPPPLPILVFRPGQDVDDLKFNDHSISFTPTQAYYELGAEIFLTVHPAGLSRSAAQDLMKRVVDIEMQMVRVLGASSSSSTQMGWKGLDTLAPQFNLSHIVRSMGYNPAIIQINGTDYFTRTSRAILANSTDATIQGFFMWKAIKKLAPWVGAEVTNKFAFRQPIGDRAPRAVIYSGNTATCISAIDRGPWTQPMLPPDLSTMSWALGRFFVERAYPPGARNSTVTMVRNIQSHLIEKIRQAKWLSDAVKRNVTNRIGSVKLTIGYDDALMDPLFSQQRMAGLGPALSESNVGNAMALARADVARLWTTLTKPTSGIVRNNWSPITVDAQYLPDAHEIYMPAGMAQAVSREPVPAFAAYGYLGTLLGHELGHIVDGRPETMKGWDKASLDAMQERITCIEKQYNGFTFTAVNGSTLHIQGRGTRVENMADQHGLRASYAAWKDMQKNPDTRDAGLPGLEGYTNDQLFFLSCKWTPCRGMGEYVLTLTQGPRDGVRPRSQNCSSG